MEKEKKNKGLIAIVIVLILVIIGLIVYICYDKGIVKNSKKEEITEKSKKETNKSKDKVVEEKDEIKPLDLTKCLNTTDLTFRDPVVATTSSGLTAKVNDDKKTVTLTIDWKTFGPLTSATAYANESQDYIIRGFEKNVKAAYVGEFGHSSVSLTLLFIMEDGTVSYMPMFVQATDQAGNMRYDVNYTYDKDASGKVTGTYFQVKGYVQGVTGAVEIYNVVGYDSNTSAVTSAMTAIAATKDGSFYNLMSVTNN